jgi:hypothetical protein
MRYRIAFSSVLVCAALAACGESPSGGPVPTAPMLSKSGAAPTAQLVASLGSAQGSTVGPGGALFVTVPTAGEIVRIDPKTGVVTTFASGLPLAILGPGSGAVDVAFIGGTAYVLVTGVAPDVGGSDVNGIYRIDSPTTFTVIADIGAWSTENPPTTPWEALSGFQYALDTFRGGFVVTDGHHNRVLQVGRDGTITQLIQFGDLVPTGLAVAGNTIYVAQAGPIPHLPENGKVVAIGPGSTSATQIAAGAPLLVDVEFGRGRSLYALSQGIWDAVFPGEPATANTGTLVQVNRNGGFDIVYAGLNVPTSLEIVGTTAYIVTLGGEVWMVDNIAGPPFGH